MKIYGLLLLTLLIAGCSESATTQTSPDTVEETLSYDKPAPEEIAYPNEEFHGYPCIGDCSGHEAGYQWAEEKDINDPDNCGGNSDSFVEGCKIYAEEHQ